MGFHGIQIQPLWIGICVQVTQQPYWSGAIKLVAIKLLLITAVTSVPDHLAKRWASASLHLALATRWFRLQGIDMFATVVLVITRNDEDCIDFA